MVFGVDWMTVRAGDSVVFKTILPWGPLTHLRL